MRVRVTHPQFRAAKRLLEEPKGYLAAGDVNWQTLEALQVATVFLGRQVA